MFGKRGGNINTLDGAKPVVTPPPAPTSAPVAPTPTETAAPARASVTNPPVSSGAGEKSEEYYDTKTSVFSALIDTIDLGQLADMEPEAAREEIRDIVNDIISIKNLAMSISEQEEILEDICNDVLGYGPLEPLLVRDDIADIMINGAKSAFIEVNGKVEHANVRFREIPS